MLSLSKKKKNLARLLLFFQKVLGFFLNAFTSCALQAPSNMKSVLQAGWLFTVAVGNIIVLIISEAATLNERVNVFVVYFFQLTSSKIKVALRLWGK